MFVVGNMSELYLKCTEVLVKSVSHSSYSHRRHDLPSQMVHQVQIYDNTELHILFMLYLYKVSCLRMIMFPLTDVVQCLILSSNHC